MFHFFRKHTKGGFEVPDSTPIEIPLSERPLTLAEQMARLVKAEDFRAALRDRGLDTFDDADDFNVDDPDLPPSPYELKGDEPTVQTRLDELRGGMVSEMPLERQERAQGRLKPKPKEPDKEKSKDG